MAIISNNVLTEGLRGMIGDQLVFRRLRGKTVVSASPASQRKESEQQRENRRRFRHASAYAKHVLSDPQKKAYYRQKARQLDLPNAYTAAITEYMRRPVVKQVTTARRKDGGDVIRVEASKRDFAMGTVEVIIKNTQGNVVEHGTATRKEVSSAHWQYRPVVKLTDDLYAVVIVMDRVGNKIIKEVRGTNHAVRDVSLSSVTKPRIVSYQLA